MHDSEKLGLYQELFTKDGYCHLSHGPDIEERIQAIDYLVIPIGKAQDNGIINTELELTIPVCQQCLDGLNDPNWILLLCINCIASQWVYKPEAKLEYIRKDWNLPYKGLILDGCPECTKQLKNIWYML